MRTKNKRHSTLEGLIKPDEPFATKLGFTSTEFHGYLWKDGRTIWVPVIATHFQGTGSLSRLFQNIERLGYKIAVPTPFVRMHEILVHLGFEPIKMPWKDSIGFDIDTTHAKQGRVYQRHKMGLKIHGFVVPPDEQVEVWMKRKK